jgi:hypothetical protein
LNRDAPRYPGDIDIFHYQEEPVAQAALGDAALLEGNGTEFSGFGAIRAEAVKTGMLALACQLRVSEL